ncbi:clasp1 [Symbiodinium natans]|uniref:Clasp1 protein n=1 Tax=Symbiodinium natans TaxID=878477 RepID=A0A812UCL1_9DINO|nr:clasp1 [Symbiodinium natans]
MAPRKLADASVDLVPSEDVQPVCCSSSRELAREMDGLQRSLDKRDDWAARCRSLKRLQGLVLGSAQLEGFAPAVLRLREVLLAQVTDLRSALVREACVALRLLAEAFGIEIEVLAASALAVLMRSTSVTILVIAESCFRCACAIVRACHAPRVVQALLEPVNARSGVQRHRGLQALLVALQTHPTERLERSAELLQKAIRDGLEDAREEVRASARQCFWAFTQKFEERGLRFLALLDAGRQRQLKAEAPAGGRLHAGAPASAAKARARSASQKRMEPEALRPPLADVTTAKSQDKRRLLRSASHKLMLKEPQPAPEPSDTPEQRRGELASEFQPPPRLPSEPEAEPRGLEEPWPAPQPEPPVECGKAQPPPSMEHLVNVCLGGGDAAGLVAVLQPDQPQARPKASHALRALHTALLEANGAPSQLAAVELLDKLLTGSGLVREAVADKCVAAPLMAALARCAVGSRAAQRVLGRWFVSEEPPPPAPPKPSLGILRRGPGPGREPKLEKEALPSLTALLAARPNAEASTLRALAAAAKAEDEETWRSQGGRVLILALNALTGSSSGREVQDASIHCIQEMILHHPACVADYAEVVACKFFEVSGRAGPDRRLATSLARALDQLLASVEPLRALEILLPQVSRNFGLLSATLRRLAAEQILTHLDVIVAPIVGAAESDSAETRKAAIFSLVDLYLIVGEDVMSYFRQELSPSQLKLVTLYAERQQCDSRGATVEADD